MSRTMPYECEHGAVLDWGDFGPDNVAGDGCAECGIDPAFFCARCGEDFDSLAAARSCTHEEAPPPAAISSRPCASGHVAYRDEWVGFVHWSGDHRPFVLCPSCCNWHDPDGADRSIVQAT